MPRRFSAVVFIVKRWNTLSFKRKFWKNAITVGGYTYTAQLIGFLSSTITSRLLLPEVYGFFALITVFTGFVSIFTNAGFGAAIIRHDYNTTFYKSIRNFTFYSGLTLFLIMVLLSYPIAVFYNKFELIIPTIVYSTIFLFRPLSIVPTAILSKHLEFSYLGKRELLSICISMALTIILAFLGFGYWSLIIPQLVDAIATYIFLEHKVKLGYKIYPWRYTRVAFRKTKSLMGNVLGFNMINYWARNADNLLVGKIYGAADLGIYNRAYMLLTLPLNMISGLFGRVLMPSLKKHMSEGGDFRKEYQNILGMISIIDFPVGAVLLLFSQPLVLLLWGKSWAPVAELLPYFGILILTQGLTTTVGNVNLLLGKERVSFRVGVANAVIMIGFIFLGAQYSMVHIARFYTLGWLALNIPILLYFGYYQNLDFKPKDILSFWGPKITISLVLLGLLWTGTHSVLPFVVVLYGLHVFIKQRTELKKALVIVRNKVKQKVR